MVPLQDLLAKAKRGRMLRSKRKEDESGDMVCQERRGAAPAWLCARANSMPEQGRGCARGAATTVNQPLVF